jgi:23S rRNA pseudouridine1911/1915/1917 synthase
MLRRTVTQATANQRLDVFAHAQLPNLSRANVQELIRQGKVTLNKTIQRAGQHVHQGDIINIDFDVKQLKPAVEPLPIVYEDDDCIVIDKPAGVLTHSKGAFNPEPTVASFIESRTHGFTGDRAGIVHRLDRATSGILIAAKHPEALSFLQRQFSLRKVKKLYYAVIEGHLNPKDAVIDMPIERHPRNPKTFRTGLTGKPATTHYTVVEQGKDRELVALSPMTGRTHQLRVHLKQLHHPIVGDTLYDGAPADRLYLHAAELELTLPNKTRKAFSSALPGTFRTMLK